MGRRSVSWITQEKLQRASLVQYEVSSPASASPPLPTIKSVAYAPIFLAPANSNSFEAFSPSPSPQLAIATSTGSHHQVPTAVIVGGSVASVVVLAAATTTIVATVAGKAGLTCLLGPLCKVLMSYLGGNPLGSAFAERLNSLRKTLTSWCPGRKQRKSNDQGPGENDGDLVDQILGGSPIAGASKFGTAAVAARSPTTLPLQNIMDGHLEQLHTSANSYLVTTASDLENLEQLQKIRGVDQMLQPLHQSLRKAPGAISEYSIFSAADNVVTDELGSSRNELVTKFKAKADNYVKDVAMADVANAAMQRHRGKNTAALLMFDEAIQAGAAEASKCRINQQQGPVLLEEVGVLQRQQGKLAAILPPSTSAAVGGSDEKEEEYLTQSVRLKEAAAGIKNEQVRIVESASDATTEALQVLDQETTGGIDASSSGATLHNNVMALVPTAHTDCATKNTKPTSRTMLEKAMVPMQCPTMMSATAAKGKWEENDLTSRASEHKHKRPSNLGHVSFSCDISVQRLRFFTSCKFGGTYGSQAISPDRMFTSSHNTRHHQNHNFQDDNNMNQILSSNYGEPNSAHYQLYVPSQSAFYNNPMHQQLHRSSQGILVEHNTSNVALPSTKHIVPLSTSPIEVIDNKLPSHGSPKSSNIDDYGGPFDGIL